MDANTKFILRQPGTYLVTLATALPQLVTLGIVDAHGDLAKWIALVCIVFASWGIKANTLAEQPRTPWTEDQRDAFRNTHPEVQATVKKE